MPRFRRTALAAALTIATAALSAAVAPARPRHRRAAHRRGGARRQLHQRRGRRGVRPGGRRQRRRPGLPRLVGGEQQRVLLPPLGERLADPGQPAGHPEPVQPGLLRRSAARHRQRLGRAGQRPARWPPSSTSCARSRRPTTSTWCWSAWARTTARSPSATSRRSAPTASSPTPGPAGGSSGRTSAGRWSRSRAPTPTWPPPRSSAAATAETTAAVRQLLTTLDQIDADGQHRVVFQDYTNPLPLDAEPGATARRTAGTTPGTSSATWVPSGTRPAARSTGPASRPGTASRRGWARW